MREIEHHKIPDLSGEVSKNQTTVFALDEPGEGGACHEYDISKRVTEVIGGVATTGNRTLEVIEFQNGPVLEHGVNGVFDEHLLAILIDRLEGFQEGPFHCVENGAALMDLRAALDTLKRRTRDRVKRGVEGRSEK